MKRLVRVKAPSNIALVKYMGKQDSALNIQSNPSISLTLNSLCTMTELERVGDGAFALHWSGASSMDGVPLRPFGLSEKDRPKVERHFQRVLAHFDEPFQGSWKVRSGNSFPAGAGIASSASGFAALTFAIAAILGREDAPRGELSSLSRQGSGSSCRSFEGPWVFWNDHLAERLPSRFEALSDIVILIEDSEKVVGSSEAHQRVKSSPLWGGRVNRVMERIEQLKVILNSADWPSFSRLSWEEALDMHELFHTSEPSFSYWKPRTREVLKWLEGLGVRSGGVRAAVTLDAGPNIHLLVPQSDENAWVDRIRARFSEMALLVDREGSGARVVFRSEAQA